MVKAIRFLSTDMYLILLAIYGKKLTLNWNLLYTKNPFIKMIQSRKAESFVWIIVWVFILAFVMLWIVNILIFSTNVTAKYNETNRIQVLKQNLTNVIKNIDTSMLQENEVFYVHKNRASTPWDSKFEIYTWSLNENYQYIDELGDSVIDINTFQWDIYSQVLWVANEDITFLDQNQVIKASIKKLVRK
jgi:hypothetical protein